MTNSGHSRSTTSGRGGSEGGSGRTSDAVGDRRWTGATRTDLLGQRAGQRSPGRIDDAVVHTTDSDAVPVPELPTLETDCYLLEPDLEAPRERRRAVLPSLHGVSLDRALSNGGDVLWIDAQGHATTHTLARVAPSQRAMKRVHVARAFTTHQHHTLVHHLARWLRGRTDSPFGTPDTDRPEVVVCPALDVLYRDGELPTEQASRLLTRSLATLAAIPRDLDVPVLITRTRDAAFTEPIAAAATTIDLEQTPLGPRFECDSLAFETLAYDVADGLLQTTFAFWQQILSARHPDVGESAASAASPGSATAASPPVEGGTAVAPSPGPNHSTGGE